MVPRRLMLLDAIPLNLSGKLDQRGLPAPTDESSDAGVEMTPTSPTVASRDGIEEEIGAVWSQVLGVSVGSSADSFFDLGGDSLTIVQAKNLLDVRFPGAVSMGDLFALPDLG